ncbi:MAG: hypothetical protein Q7U54_05410 [Bacteroidales bacterium]|nr:hypothetical protein [Bacteroidales bacterium]
MKKILIGILIVLLFEINLKAQQISNDYKTFEIDKTVKDFPNEFNLSSPLKSFICFKYLKSEGKQGSYRSVNSYKIQGSFPIENASNITIDDAKKEALLNTKIYEIIIYNDSVAGIITDFQPPMQIITYLTLEDGKWLNAGEGFGGNDLNESRSKFKENADVQLKNIHQITKLKNVSKDTLSFINFLRENSKEPKQFILQALSEHKIVIYGELHKRQKSWELLKTVVNDSKFHKEVGTVFMELSSDKQAELDTFFKNQVIDKELILNIFRDVQIYGLYDRGEYEFLIELWKVNKKLPSKKQIRVVAVDEPRPFKTFKNSEEKEAHFNQTLERNEQMAKIISQTVRSQNDKRNNLFIVGLAHAYKSILQDMAIGSQKGKMKPTAASQLSAIFSQDEVFTIIQHIPVVSNNGTVHGEIRKGVFDYAFSVVGNKSIAFNLKNSPFGKEPFDALYEISYNKMTGNYEDNYDAYLFIEPLKTESVEYLFDDILTDDFLKELDRRAKITNTTLEKWFGVDKATLQTIKETKQFNPNKRRWPNL